MEKLLIRNCSVFSCAVRWQPGEKRNVFIKTILLDEKKNSCANQNRSPTPLPRLGWSSGWVDPVLKSSWLKIGGKGATGGAGGSRAGERLPAEDIGSLEETTAGSRNRRNAPLSAWISCMWRFWTGPEVKCWFGDLKVLDSSLIAPIVLLLEVSSVRYRAAGELRCRRF